MRPFNKRNLEKQEAAQQAEGDQLYKLMMLRCIPVAKRILKLIVEDDLPIGDGVIKRGEDGRALPMTKAERPQTYQDAARKVQQLMLDENLLWAEKELVFALVKQPMDILQGITLADLEKTYQDGLCRLFGVQVVGEISFKQIDDLLKQHPPHANPT